MTSLDNSILVYVGLDAVGDGLIKLPFVRALRAAFPQARITWMAGKGHSVFADTLAPLVHGLIDEVIDEAHIGSRVGELLRRPLPGRSFDLIIDTQRRLLTTLILRRIRHGRFISAAGGFLLSDARPRVPTRPAAMVAQLMTLIELAGGEPAAGEAPLPRDAATEALADTLLPPGPDYVGLAPGAGGKHKCWPLERFCALAATISAKGMTPVFLLGPAETEWMTAIRAEHPDALLPLQQVERPSAMLTIALGRRMRAAIANDSGTGHMLAAAGIPLVSLFGPTPPDKFAPSASRLTILRAQDFGGSTMEKIPASPVEEALLRSLS
ncbi:MAG: glycosyltransferase family 9 protein [Phaeospirillum sp.]|nr:glycosyltransferase family 9 protein [Phaeospirillum sp.]